MNIALIGLLGVVIGGAISACVALAIARADRINSVRLAALEKRLAVHQEAYVLWHELLSTLHNRQLGPQTAIKCQEFWVKNCLYLDPVTRREFRICAQEAFMWNELKGTRDPKEPFERISKVLDHIVRGVKLPPIGENEGKQIPGGNSSSNSTQSN